MVSWFREVLLYSKILQNCDIVVDVVDVAALPLEVLGHARWWTPSELCSTHCGCCHLCPGCGVTYRVPAILNGASKVWKLTLLRHPFVNRRGLGAAGSATTAPDSHHIVTSTIMYHQIHIAEWNKSVFANSVSGSVRNRRTQRVQRSGGIVRVRWNWEYS